MDPLNFAALHASLSNPPRRGRATEDAFYARFGRPAAGALSAASTIAVIAACVVVVGAFGA